MLAVPFTVLSSAGKAACVEEGLFFGRGRAAQDAVTVRKAPEPADDVGVVLGIFHVFGIGRRRANSSMQRNWSGRCSECMNGI